MAARNAPTAAAAYFMPAPADRCIAALRKWIDAHAHAPRPLPPPIGSREALFDRWGQHTAHCVRAQRPPHAHARTHARTRAQIPACASPCPVHAPRAPRAARVLPLPGALPGGRGGHPRVAQARVPRALPLAAGGAPLARARARRRLPRPASAAGSPRAAVQVQRLQALREPLTRAQATAARRRGLLPFWLARGANDRRAARALRARARVAPLSVSRLSLEFLAPRDARLTRAACMWRRRSRARQPPPLGRFGICLIRLCYIDHCGVHVFCPVAVSVLRLGSTARLYPAVESPHLSVAPGEGLCL